MICRNHSKSLVKKKEKVVAKRASHVGHVCIFSFHVFPFIFFFFITRNFLLSFMYRANILILCIIYHIHKLHFSAIFFIKNRSHNTIYIFKNYFITIFLVFNFQLYPNIPIEYITINPLFLHYCTLSINQLLHSTCYSVELVFYFIL